MVDDSNSRDSAPLALQLRPKKISDFIGQQHLLGEGKPLWQIFQKKILHPMILWGPPGTGKTTLAYLLGNSIEAEIISVSAVTQGVKDLRQVMDIADKNIKAGKRTVLFIDEIHRFNKSQQDFLLPFVEKGIIILIGATTENPSFSINNALLSRTRIYTLQKLLTTDLLEILNKAISHFNIHFPDSLKEKLCVLVDGDARQLLIYIEILIATAQTTDPMIDITDAIFSSVLSNGVRHCDNHGEWFYDLISALHKSIRGSDPQASLYWFARMIDGGIDPLYIGRRLLRLASEDIGNADPRALSLTLDAIQVFERLGSPEGELALAQAVTYLASTEKSNAVYTAWHKALSLVQQTGSLEIPLHLRNAPTPLMKHLGYGKAYRYAHDEPNAYAAGENYFPDTLKGTVFYTPSDRGLEKNIQTRLNYLKSLDKSKQSGA